MLTPVPAETLGQTKLTIAPCGFFQAASSQRTPFVSGENTIETGQVVTLRFPAEETSRRESGD
jgi:hypothetical protein